MAKTPLPVRVGGGMNNAADPSELNAERGELTEAIGVVYTRGGSQCNWKQGRTAFDASATVGGDAALGGIEYCEFSATGASNELVARSGTVFYTATAGLTGTFASARTGMTDTPTGLWKTFANNRYHFNDGVSAPWTHWYNSSASTPSYITRASGLQPVQFVPLVTPQTSSGGTGIVLTAATVSVSGDKNYTDQDKFVDGSVTTRAYVQLGTNGNNAKIKAGGFTGTGSGARSDWIVQVTYETQVDGDGRGSTLLEYTTNFTDGSPTWKQFEKVNDAIGTHTVSQSLAGTSIDSAVIGVRVTTTKTNGKGHIFNNAFDARLTNQQGSGSNTATIGVRYWWTERVDIEGISSTSGSQYVSDSTGAFANASGTLVTCPPALANSNATHWDLYRTADGGVYPVGTRVTSLNLVDENGVVTLPLSYTDTSNPATAASSNTYGVLIVAGISYERDIVPPISTVMETFQNLVVVAPVDQPATLRYSAPDYPESFPTINLVTLNSDRDDDVIAMARLGARLGVFMRSRCRRIDHLPVVTDPEFSVAPEDFAPDHGCESRNGVCYATLPGENAEQVLYVARDGIRVTNLYTTNRLTDVIDWSATVDVSRLSESSLRNNASESRLEFFFVPTAAFMAGLGLTGDAAYSRMCMWLSYADMPLRASFQLILYHSAVSMPLNGVDYTVILTTSGPNTASGIVYIDEVGTTDATKSFNSSGHVPKRVQTMWFYGTEGEFLRTRLIRLFVDHMTGSGDASVIVYSRNDNDDNANSTITTSETLTYSNSASSKPLYVNQSGQAHQIRYVRDDAATTPQPLSSFSMMLEYQGEIT